MADVWKVLRGVLYLLLIAFLFGVTWGTCVLGSRLVQHVWR